MDRLITQAAWMIFILLLCCSIKAGIDNYLATEHELEGIAKSNFISYYHGLEVLPEEARHLNIVVTTYDITFQDMNIFTK